MTTTLGRRLGLGLASVYLVFGVLELWTHSGQGASVLLYWGISLIGGGVILLAGVLVPWPRAWIGSAVVIVGLLTGLNAVLWTIVVPLFAMAVLVAAVYREEPDRPS